jgi:hypothetical protein
MITLEHYFAGKEGSEEITREIESNAKSLLVRVNRLLAWASGIGYEAANDPDTGSQISGSKGGAGDGGFRLSTSATGAAKSAHKRAMAVDVYDPGNVLDRMIDNTILETFRLYRESPIDTPGWCHLQSVPPASGRRTFKP